MFFFEGCRGRVDDKKGIIDLLLAGRAAVSVVIRDEWIDRYKTNGIRTLLVDSNANYVAKSSLLKNEKKEKLIKLLHESPQLHGFNRTSWRLVDLAKHLQSFTAYRRGRVGPGICERERFCIQTD